MRVIIVTETFLPKMDGIVRVICLLLDHLTANGIETAVVAPRLGADAKDWYNETRIIRTDGFRVPIYPELKFAPPGIRAYRQIRAFDADVAHFFHPVMIGLPSFFIAKQLGIPTLTSFHLDYARIARHYTYGPFNLGILGGGIDWLTRVIFNWADYSLAPSGTIQKRMHDLGIKEVGLWKRGVDAEKFHPRHASPAMRERLTGGHPNDRLLLYVGRLSAEKNLQHIKPVLERLPNTRLALVGDGPYRPELEAIFAGTRTTFTGYLYGDDLTAAYASADVFVFPSALETFGLVVVEAMAAGLPVVASQVGGIPDVVEEGVNGYTFPVGDIEKLIAGVEQVTADAQRMQAMSQQARAFAETQTWGHMMDEVIEVYEKLARY